MDYNDAKGKMVVLLADCLGVPKGEIGISSWTERSEPGCLWVLFERYKKSICFPLSKLQVVKDRIEAIEFILSMGIIRKEDIRYLIELVREQQKKIKDFTEALSDIRASTNVIDWME